MKGLWILRMMVIRRVVSPAVKGVSAVLVASSDIVLEVSMGL